MIMKLMKSDASHPSKAFGKTFTDYLKGLPMDVQKTGGNVMQQIWHRTGGMGIIGLLLCLYWQAEYVGKIISNLSNKSSMPFCRSPICKLSYFLIFFPYLLCAGKDPNITVQLADILAPPNAHISNYSPIILLHLTLYSC